MQAQHQSSPAARIPSTAPPPTPVSSAPTLSSPPATLSVANSIGLAHDAGNLLAALGLYTDLLSLPGVLRPEHRHYAAELSLISSRSSELIQRMLSLPIPPAAAPAREQVESTPAIAALPNTRHADTLRGIAPILQRIAASDATVTVTCPATLPPLGFSAEIIERITLNLVRNAAEAIRAHRKLALASAQPPLGEIRVTLAVVSGRAQLTVADNGPGMSPAIAAAFLQPLPLPQGASRGLGHRIVHELAAASAGQLSIRIRPGLGTELCLKWPLSNGVRSTPLPSATHTTGAHLVSSSLSAEPISAEPAFA
jgi:signal transduction histidine kinase